MVRIEEDMWVAYGELCAEEGTSRADDVRRHVHSRVNAWHKKKAIQRRLESLDAPDPAPKRKVVVRRKKPADED